LRDRERFAELDTARHLVGRQVLRAVIDDLFGDARPTLAHHHDARDHHRATERIGDDADLRLLHLGERLEALLHFPERDALAVDLDELVLAAGQVDAPGLVEVPDVAGAQPALVVDATDGDRLAARARLRHRLARHRLRLHPDRAVALARAVAILRLAVADAHLDALDDLADRAGTRLFLVARDRRRLRRVIDGRDADAPAILERVRRR